jgi:hypothetical protein
VLRRGQWVAVCEYPMKAVRSKGCGKSGRTVGADPNISGPA